MQRPLLNSIVCGVLLTRASSCVTYVNIDSHWSCTGQRASRVVKVEVF